MQNNKSRKINIFNRITLMLLIVLVQVGIIAYGIYTIQSKISENTDYIKKYQTTAEEIAQVNTTTEQIAPYLNNISVLEDNYPSPENFEELVEEIESLSDKLGIQDLTVTLEEGLNKNLDEILLSSNFDKTKKVKYDGLDSTNFFIVIKSDYQSAINFISWLEKSKLVNNIKGIRMDKREIETATGEDQTIDNYEYIETTIESTFYFRLITKKNAQD